MRFRAQARAVMAIGGLLLLAACGPPAKSVQPIAAEAALATAASNFLPPPPDRARVIIVSGQTMRYTGTGGNYIAMHYKPGDIWVNDTMIGTLNGLEAMVFELAPGAYTFRWTPFKSGVEELKRAKPSSHNLNGGGLLALSTWYDSGLIVDQRYEMHTVNRDPRNVSPNSRGNANSKIVLKSDIMIVKPANCPATLCK